MNNEEKRTVSGFEKFVFNTTRTSAICGAALILVIIAVLTIKLMSSSNTTNVSYSEVVKEMEKSNATTDSDSYKTEQVPIPNDLKPYFIDENVQVLQGWLEALSEEQQKDFLANMSSIIREAKTKEINPLEIVNAYKSIKIEKLNAGGFEEYASKATKAGYIAAIFGLFLILSILSLVLVMLAIERNTRNISA